MPKTIFAKLTPLIAAFIMTTAPVAVYAQNGADDSAPATATAPTQSEPEHTAPIEPATTSTTTPETHKSGKSRAVKVAKTAPEHVAKNEVVENSDNDTLHHKGDALLEHMKKQHGDTKKTPEQRLKTCEAHKQGLTSKFSHIVANSQRAQDRIDDIFTKAQAYSQSSTAVPANIAELIATATTAQSASAASIASLKTVTPTIDCNNTSTASDVATFKAAAQETRANLKAYKSAVKAVLHALQPTETIKPPTTTTPEGTN